MTQSQGALAELGGANFHDARLSARLIHLCGCFAASPATSLPNACGSSAASKAGLSLLRNARVTPRRILAPPHIARTPSVPPLLPQLLLPQLLLPQLLLPQLLLPQLLLPQLLLPQLLLPQLCCRSSCCRCSCCRSS